MLEIKTYVLTPFLLEGLTVLGMTVVGRPLFIPYRRSRKRSSVHLSLTFSNLFFFSLARIPPSHETTCLFGNRIDSLDR